MDNAIERAVEIAGGKGHGQKARAARAFGISPAYLNKILRTGHVPVEQCRAIESATSKAVTVEELRPDIFVAEDSAA